MTEGPLERTESLGQRILEILIERIKTKVYPPNTRFPSQNELADEFQVSRATVRSAVDKLAAQGLLEKRQGVGTWVSASPMFSRTTNMFGNLPLAIAKKGLNPGVEIVEAKEVKPDKKIAAALELEPDDTIVQMKVTFTADGVPVMYSLTSFPISMLGRELADEVLVHPEITEPKFIEFIEKRCQQEIKHFSARLRAERLKNYPLAIYPEDKDEIGLVFDELCINIHDRPIVHVFNFFPSNRIEYCLLRPPARSDDDILDQFPWRIHI
jgi:GntR family transcriptional regulator